MTHVAIVIVTYNGERYLTDLFDSLCAHTDLVRTEVIVVDNASSDATVAGLRAVRGVPRLHVLPQTTNRGFAGGNNVGLAEARRLGARYAILLNQDTVVTAGWLDRLVEIMDARPDVAAAQPLLMLFDEPELINSCGNAIHFCGFGYCRGYRKRVSEVSLDERPRSVPYASGAALLLRMSALDEVGDFDEMLFLYHEDCDLQVRLRQAGYDCVLVPRSVVFHKYTPTFSTYKYGQLDRNRWVVLLKEWPGRRLLAAAPALLGVEIAVLVFAARQGWLREKLRGYRDILVALPSIVAMRRRILAARAANASDQDHLTGKIEFEGLDHPLITRLANPVLAAYWSLVGQRLEAR